MRSVVAVDLGKTSSKLGLWRADTPGEPSARPDVVRQAVGVPGIAFPGGLDAAESAIISLYQEVRQHIQRPWALTVGAAGSMDDPAAAQRLARRLFDILPADDVAVCGDSVTAHAGALRAQPGVVLSMGTGSVAVGVKEDGTMIRVDGWGPWLGDEGSGGWIGLAGLRAAMAAFDGRAPATTLERAAKEFYGELVDLPRLLAEDGGPVQNAARFAGSVSRAADDGDLAAVEIIERAARALATTVLTAAAQVQNGSNPVAVAITGGLRELGAVLLDPVMEHLANADLTIEVHPPAGNSLDGARILTHRHDTPFEPVVHRQTRSTDR
ncbi:MAG: BadF/BadG/BcrA/BcrD ATPase family protein [Rhodococcus erythropolis]